MLAIRVNDIIPPVNACFYVDPRMLWCILSLSDSHEAKEIEMTELEQILMQRDGITLAEAKEMIAEAREAILNGEENVMMDVLGIEEDYIFDVL